MEQVSGWSEQGGSVVTVPGTQGSGAQRFQQSFRGATITVRDSSNNLATIYSDDLATPTAKANPFTASSTTGSWSFYVVTGTYSVTFSGGSITAPFSITVNVGLGNAGGVPSYAFASLPTSKTQNAGDIARVTNTLGGLWMDSGIQWVKQFPVVNVMDAPFNARGDGSTDDTTAIQAAIDAVNPTSTAVTDTAGRIYGGVVYFPPKHKFKFTTTLKVPAHVILIGSGGLAEFTYDFVTGTSATLPGSTLYYVPSNVALSAIQMSGWVTATGAYIASDGTADATNIGSAVEAGTMIGSQGAGLVNLNIVSSDTTARMGVTMFGNMQGIIHNVLIKNFRTGIASHGSWNPSFRDIYVNVFDTTGVDIWDTASNLDYQGGWLHGGVLGVVTNVALKLTSAAGAITGVQFELTNTGINLAGANDIFLCATFDGVHTTCIYNSVADNQINAVNCLASLTLADTVAFLDGASSNLEIKAVIDNLRHVNLDRVLGSNITGANISVSILNTALAASDSLTSIAAATRLDWWTDPRERRLNGNAEIAESIYLPGASSTWRTNWLIGGTGRWYTVITTTGLEFRDFATGNLFWKIHLDQVSIETAFGNKLFGVFGSPEGATTATIGSIAMRVDGAANAAVYGKIAGTGNTGWAPLAEGGMGANITAAANIVLGPEGSFTVVGNTNISSITASTAGRKVTLLFTGTPTVVDGSNLTIAGNLVCTAGTTLSLLSDGTNWIETSRSVN